MSPEHLVGPEQRMTVKKPLHIVDMILGDNNVNKT